MSIDESKPLVEWDSLWGGLSEECAISHAVAGNGSTSRSYTGPSADNWNGPRIGSAALAPFPTERRVWRREIDSETPVSEVNAWIEESGVVLGPLVPDRMQEDVRRVLYTYRDLHAESIADIPPTDLYTHRPRLKDDVVPWNKSLRRRWNEPQKYWLDRLIREGIESGMYEYTMAANGEFSDWSAEPVLVEKDPENPWAEQRLTFNYKHMHENVPAVANTLLAEVHDELSDPRIGSYSQFDLKHAYCLVPIHLDYRHVFACNVPGHAQLQLTRMAQGSQSAGYSISEVLRLGLGAIPGPLPEPSLMSAEPGGLRPLTTFMDDLLAKHETFEEQWEYVRDHLLPRLL